MVTYRIGSQEPARFLVSRTPGRAATFRDLERTFAQRAAVSYRSPAPEPRLPVLGCKLGTTGAVRA